MRFDAFELKMVDKQVALAILATARPMSTDEATLVDQMFKSSSLVASVLMIDNKLVSGSGLLTAIKTRGISQFVPIIRLVKGY